jgi:hypothetical protein
MHAFHLHCWEMITTRFDKVAPPSLTAWCGHALLETSAGTAVATPDSTVTSCVSFIISVATLPHSTAQNSEAQTASRLRNLAQQEQHTMLRKPQSDDHASISRPPPALQSHCLQAKCHL